MACIGFKVQFKQCVRKGGELVALMDSCMWNITWQHNNLRFKIGEHLYLAQFTEQTKDYIGDGFFVFMVVMLFMMWLIEWPTPSKKALAFFFLMVLSIQIIRFVEVYL